ncbi:MAG: hypothetical protein WKF43_08950 [Acidimicrobiales bacterium]
MAYPDPLLQSIQDALVAVLTPEQLDVAISASLSNDTFGEDEITFGQEPGRK